MARRTRLIKFGEGYASILPTLHAYPVALTKRVRGTLISIVWSVLSSVDALRSRWDCFGLRIAPGFRIERAR